MPKIPAQRGPTFQKSSPEFTPFLKNRGINHVSQLVDIHLILSAEGGGIFSSGDISRPMKNIPPSVSSVPLW
jgi:hypothetical protein